MKSCLNCRHTEDTLFFDEIKKCVNEKSVYNQEMVDESDLCKEWENEE